MSLTNEQNLEADLSKALGNIDDDVQEETTNEGETQAEVAKIKLGDREYSSEELESLVGLGQKAKEIEKNHGDFDSYISEFGRKSQKIGDLTKEIERLQSGKTEPQNELSGDSLEEARQAARKLGIPLTDDVKTMVQEILDEKFSTKYSEVRAGEKLFDESKSLEKEIDGKDGRPRFEAAKVLEFMKENPGFKTPKQAYEAMYPDQMAQWRVDQILKSKKGLTTQTDTQANKRPGEVRVTKDNLSQLIAEQFVN